MSQVCKTCSQILPYKGGSYREAPPKEKEVMHLAPNKWPDRHPIFMKYFDKIYDILLKFILGVFVSLVIIGLGWCLFSGIWHIGMFADSKLIHVNWLSISEDGKMIIPWLLGVSTFAIPILIYWLGNWFLK